MLDFTNCDRKLCPDRKRSNFVCMKNSEIGEVLNEIRRGIAEILCSKTSTANNNSKTNCRTISNNCKTGTVEATTILPTATAILPTATAIAKLLWSSSGFFKLVRVSKFDGIRFTESAVYTLLAANFSRYS